ncbi:Endonuclease/exonuclease/phosphatase, partial [Trema orientale]
MKIFDELIRELNLKDLPLSKTQFTWSNFWCCRLDRFSYGRQEAEVRAIFDHCPVILDFSKANWGPTPSRFDVWLENKDFSKAFEGWWRDASATGWEGYKFMMRLKISKD